jgi:hypothetical protein
MVRSVAGKGGSFAAAAARRQLAPWKNNGPLEAAPAQARLPCR